MDDVWKEHWGKTWEVWSICGSHRSFAMYVPQVLGAWTAAPSPSTSIVHEAVIFLAVALQRARCVLTSAGTCG